MRAFLMVAGLGLATIAPTPALAGERTAGHAAANAGASRAVGAPIAGRTLRHHSARNRVAGVAGREIDLTDETARQAYTLVGRSRDGKEVRKVPSEELVRAIVAARSKSAERDVVGKDNRTRVTKTQDFPYSAVGFLYFEDPNEKDAYYGCAATVIARNIAITAADCLYYYPEMEPGKGGYWNENFTLWPGLDGNDNAPFGSYVYDTAYVLNGWIDNYDGTWDSVLPYEVGVVVFTDPVGDATGWVGAWNFDPAEVDGWKAMVADYPLDKQPENSMWQSTCTFKAKDVVAEYLFENNCDSDGWGASVAVHDKQDDGDYILGIQVGTSGDRNLALKIYDPVFQWLSGLGVQ